MSVNSYLTSLASALVLKDTEKTSINTSLSTIKIRVSCHFGSMVIEHFQFGSSTRGTILPRKADANSDIDYMVVFSTNTGAANVLAWLKREEWDKELQQILGVSNP